jgi:EAL domain-containing protein (putative c-di-GMP-specific phosphodiesterase class I)
MDGDEFAVIHNINGQADIESAADKILNAMRTPINIFNQEVYVSVSIGISVFPDQGNTSNDLIKNAASSVNAVKNTKRSSYMIYSSEVTEYNHQKFSIHSELCQAIERNQFVLHYQPKIDGKTSQTVGIEALIRWNHPQRGLLYPIDFIPIAEETGVIKYIDEWVLNTACTQLQKWLQEGMTNIRLAVNLSAWQFKDHHLLEIVSKALADTGIDPSYLELEITETAALENFNFTQNILTKLMDMGISISIDDFGTGYSSLSYLKNLPISFLKIDKSFVADLLSDKNTYSIVKAIIDVAHALQLKVIAEGVENQEQLDVLRTLDCDEIQGYHVSRPLNVEDIRNHIKDNTK